jgi:hypothetical protein
MVASEEGCNGGSVPEDDGSRRGVEVFEFSVEGGRTRFARKKEKKAGKTVSSAFHELRGRATAVVMAQSL